jgi:tRNA pseudouridine38/39 synthase
VETHLFAALHATRLIAPDATWSSCEYSRCGRTDKGVSALRQIVALRCRSRGEDVAPEAELDYVQLLNRQLPPDIRVLNWRPAPPRFSARFSGRWRQYKYFFWDDGSMDLGAMRDAAARLVVRCAYAFACVFACTLALTHTRLRALQGDHDFRNFCKMDVVNVSNFVRRIHFVTVDAEADRDDALAAATAASAPEQQHAPPHTAERHLGRLMSLNVRGNAFLYHQVRCMATVLFMVGRREELPSIVSTLLDVATMPRKPMYEMAPEEALLFQACGYEEGVLPPGVRTAGADKARAILVTHLRAVARHAAVRAHVMLAALQCVAAAEPAPCALQPHRHVPLMQRKRELTYEEQVERVRGKAAAKEDAVMEGE